MPAVLLRADSLRTLSHLTLVVLPLCCASIGCMSGSEQSAEASPPAVDNTAKTEKAEASKAAGESLVPEAQQVPSKAAAEPAALAATNKKTSSAAEPKTKTASAATSTNQTGKQTAVATESTITRDLEELLAVLDAALRKSANPRSKAAASSKSSKKKSKAKKNGDSEEAPVVTPQQQVAAAIAAADEIIEHPDADDVQVASAWKSKLKLSYRGALREWDGFEQRLVSAVADVKAADGMIDEAEYGSGLLLVSRSFGKSVPAHEAVDALIRHAEEFRNGKTVIRMFVTYARKLVERHDLDAAKRCCNVAIWQCNNHPDIRAAHTLLYRLNTGQLRTVVSAREKLPTDSLQKRLEKEIAQIQKMIPMKLDPVTTLTKIAPGPHTIIYTYEITQKVDAVVSKKSTIRKAVTKNAKTTLQTKRLLNKGVKLEYRYYDTKGNRLFAFVVEK